MKHKAGPTKRTGRPGHPRTFPLRFPPAGKSPPLQPVPFCHKWTAVNVRKRTRFP